MISIHTYCSRTGNAEFARAKRFAHKRWTFVVAGEWSQTPCNAGNVRFRAAGANLGHRWALLSVGFPTRIAAVAEADRPVPFADIVGLMMRQLRADGGEYLDGYHDWNDKIDIDRVRSVYRGEVPELLAEVRA